MSRKNRTKETSVEDVKKEEEQLNKEETVAEQTPETTSEGDGEQGSNEGNEKAATDGAEGEEPPAPVETKPEDVVVKDEAPAEPEGVLGAQGNVGDVGLPLEETPALELAPAVALAALSETPAAVEEPEAPLQTFVKKRSDKVEALVGYIREYVERMHPSLPQDAKSGVPIQARLYRMLVELQKLDYVDFKDGMDDLLSLIFENRHAAFSDLYSRRFFEALYPTLTHDQVREFDEVLSILVTVGSATNRSRAMRHVDLAAALKSVKNPKAQQNMSAYFGALR